jgi:hypothetical protein
MILIQVIIKNQAIIKHQVIQKTTINLTAPMESHTTKTPMAMIMKHMKAMIQPN